MKKIIILVGVIFTSIFLFAFKTQRLGAQSSMIVSERAIFIGGKIPAYYYNHDYNDVVYYADYDYDVVRLYSTNNDVDLFNFTTYFSNTYQSIIDATNELIDSYFGTTTFPSEGIYFKDSYLLLHTVPLFNYYLRSNNANGTYDGTYSIVAMIIELETDSDVDSSPPLLGKVEFNNIYTILLKQGVFYIVDDINLIISNSTNYIIDGDAHFQMDEGALNNAYQSGINRGKTIGVREAYDGIYQSGYEAGLSASQGDVYQSGYNDGINALLTDDEIYQLGIEYGSNKTFLANLDKWIVPAIILVLIGGGFIAFAKYRGSKND